MNRLFPILLAFLFGFQHFTRANVIIDSLRLQLNGNKDTSQVIILDELCWQYSTSNTDSAVYFGIKALQLSKQIKYTKGIAQAHNDIGIACYYAGNFKESIQNYEQSLVIRLKLGDKRDIAAIYNKLGIVYQKLSKFTEALYYNILALKLFEEIGYDLGTASGYNNIAIINDNLGHLEKAIFYHKKSIAIKERINDRNGLGGSYSNLGNVYRQQEKFTQSATFYLKAIKIFRTTNDPEYLTSTLNNLGNLYVLMRMPNKALPFLLEAKELREKNTDKKALASSYINIADAYKLLKNSKAEEEYISKALALTKYLDGMREKAVIQLKVANSLADNGKNSAAVFYFRNYISLNDSLINRDVVGKVAEMETKYETEKKEAENKLLQQENQLKEFDLKAKRIQLYLAIGVCLLIIVIALFVYTRYKHKKELELNATIIREEQKRLAAIIETQEEERKRISGELHDGIGQMLAVVKMNMSVLKEEFPIQRLQQAIQLLDESCSELRNISHDLMPASLIKNGMVYAIKDFVDHVNSAGKLHVSFYADTFNRVHPSIEINIYRIIQEAINNILKHAKATEVNLSLNSENNMVKLMISDNGIGLAKDAIKHSKGNGWSNIYSRTQIMQGQVEIDSSPNNGTTLFIDVPLLLKEEAVLATV